MIQFQENAWTEGQKDGRKDGKALFHRALQATAEGPKIQDYRIKSTYLFQFKSKIWNITFCNYNIWKIFGLDSVK